MTLLDALRERSSEADADLQRATDALMRALPMGRSVEITPDVIDAAFAGDHALLVALLAEEEEPTPEDIEAQATLEDDGSRATIEDVRRELGLETPNLTDPSTPPV